VRFPSILIVLSGVFTSFGTGLAQIDYDSGNPTTSEQLMLELVNRARANPGAEAARLGIDLNQSLAAGTISNTPKPPLASNPRLIASARAHSQWMLDTDTFSHTGMSGSDPGQRMEAAGYVFSGSWTWGENIGWRGSTGDVDPDAFTRLIHDGLFLSAGHRVNICNATFDEVGLGIQAGVMTSDGTDWNALLGTQNFAASGSTPSPMLVGVAYYDFNGDNFYDPGEGISGIGVNVSGASYRTTTAGAGGFAMPVPNTAATRTVTFSGPALNVQRNVAFPGSVNWKEDLRLVYSPPTITGNLSALVRVPHSLAISQVPGATAYAVRVSSAQPAATDPAESIAPVAVATSWDYDVLDGGVRDTGSYSYRLAHNGLGDETLTYQKKFLPGAGGQISFRSRLYNATSYQVAAVEISEDGGVTWDTIYSQAGGGETAFTTRTLSLSFYANKGVTLRFRYSFQGGSYYPGTDYGKGWHIDNVQFTDVRELTDLQSLNIPAGEALEFVADQPGAYLVQAQPANGWTLWPPGPLAEITASALTSFGGWSSAWERALALASGSLTPTGSHLGDGVPNLLKYAAGLAPSAPASGASPVHAVEEVLGARHLTFSFRRIAGAGSGSTENGYSVGGVTYVVETSSSLLPGSWQTGAAQVVQTSLTANSDGTETVTVRLLSPLSSKQFVRLRVTQN